MDADTHTQTHPPDNDRELIERYIALNPHKPWVDEARLVDYWIPVWALIGYLDAVDGDVDATASAYHIPREAMDAALAYYRQHTCAIDLRIEANNAPVILP